MKNFNPYQNLNSNKFWRTAVADKTFNQIYEDIWQPKFNIDKDSKIIAAGSCFAQHVGTWLNNNGYAFSASKIDTTHSFSFAFGNIYTAALLKQWVESALGNKDLSDIYFEKNGKFFDLLRPSINTKGFNSLDELLMSRQDAVEEMLQAFKSSDVFIFTLGLTEAWVNNDGIYYAMCPGTLCGEFDPKNHKFKNFTADECKDDLNQTLDLIKSINPNIKFLLTVSPVPLTATASEEHVLPATIHSKSILRTTAGHLFNNRNDVDYFPSYELITSTASKGSYFEENLRNVTKEGVSFVMSHLEAAFSKDDTLKTHKSNNKTAAIKPNQHDEAACEDVFLEKWNSHDEDVSSPLFCLIGDSHMGKMSSAFIDLKTPIIGGMIMNGSAWTSTLFHLDLEEFFVPLENKNSRTVWQKIINNLNECDQKPVILTNIGLQTHRSIATFFKWMVENKTKTNADANYFFNYFIEELPSHLNLLKSFVGAGFKVIVISDPPLQSYIKEGEEHIGIYQLYEKLFETLVVNLGCEFINTRTWIAEKFAHKSNKKISNFLAIKNSEDIIHGSDAYYKELAKKIIAKYS